MEFLLGIVWLMLPAGFANMSPVLFKKINFLNKPVDFGKKYKDGKFIFGKNKTYRGFFFGILVSILILWIQVLLFNYVKEITFFDYSKINILLWGFLFGFGALFGDLIESFFKRRVGIESGKSWPVFDQVDWVIGGLILLSFVQVFNWKIYLITIIFWGIAHPIINLIGYWIGLKKNKF